MSEPAVEPFEGATESALLSTVSDVNLHCSGSYTRANSKTRLSNHSNAMNVVLLPHVGSIVGQYFQCTATLAFAFRQGASHVMAKSEEVRWKVSRFE